LTDVVVGEQMLTSRQIALLTHLSYETVVRLIRRGDIPGVRRTPGGQYRLPASSVDVILRPDPLAAPVRTPSA
jgi:excisionase family DNA binding protein